VVCPSLLLYCTWELLWCTRKVKGSRRLRLQGSVGQWWENRREREALAQLCRTQVLSLFFATLKKQSSEILILFFYIYSIDRARPEYEPLLILKLFRGPHDLRSKTIFFTRLRRNRFQKIILFGKILQIY
jgi:hypothetical protein